MVQHPEELDPSKRAASGLEAALEETGTDEQNDGNGEIDPEKDIVIVDEKLKEREAERKKQKKREKQVIRGKETENERVDVEEELRATPILTEESNRTAVRLLVVTRDGNVMTDESAAAKRLYELAGLFAEIHVIVLSTKADRLGKTKRARQNIWIYPTDSSRWWLTPYEGYRLAKRELVFGGDFRPDIIIADDPFEAGLVGSLLAGKFKRPLQVHVTENFYDPNFPDAAPHNGLRIFIARYTLWKTDCVRTNSEHLKKWIIEKNSDLAEFTEVLPYHYNLGAWRDAEPTFDLHERYPQFKFILLHVSDMTEDSHTDRVINGCARTLYRYPSVGLIIVGDGPKRDEMEKHVRRLGFEHKVAFEQPPNDDLVSYMKSANLLVHLSESTEEDETVLQAAAAGLPMVTGEAGISGELFVDGQDAFICPNDSPPCISEKIKQFMNDNRLRTQFELNARDIVFDRVEQDYGAYLRAYKASIERCVVQDT